VKKGRRRKVSAKALDAMRAVAERGADAQLDEFKRGLPDDLPLEVQHAIRFFDDEQRALSDRVRGSS